MPLIHLLGFLCTSCSKCLFSQVVLQYKISDNERALAVFFLAAVNGYLFSIAHRIDFESMSHG